MQFEERAYTGKSLRPKPIVLRDEGLGIVVVLTAWGNRDEMDRAQRFFSDQVRSLESTEHTAAFGRIESLSAKANQLRVACYLCHDFMFREINRLEFVSAVEVLALHLENNVLSWAQVGAPNLYLRRQNELQPLAVQLDLGWEFQQAVPLTSAALGLDPVINPQCGSMYLPPQSDLLLLSRSHMPGSLYANCPDNLASFSNAVAKADPEMPFWSAWIKS